MYSTMCGLIYASSSCRNSIKTKLICFSSDAGAWNRCRGHARDCGAQCYRPSPSCWASRNTNPCPEYPVSIKQSISEGEDEFEGKTKGSIQVPEESDVQQICRGPCQVHENQVTTLLKLISFSSHLDCEVLSFCMTCKLFRQPINFFPRPVW